MGRVIDTSVLIDAERRFERGAEDAFEGLPEDSVVTAIQIGELRAGLLLAGSETRRSLRAEFLEHLKARCPVLAFGAEEASVWAELYVDLRRRGTPVGERDLIIAATAIANGHRVMTHNLREFQQIPGLNVLTGPQAPAE